MSSEANVCPSCGHRFKFECHLTRHRMRSQRCNRIVTVDDDDSAILSDASSILSSANSLSTDQEFTVDEITGCTDQAFFHDDAHDDDHFNIGSSATSNHEEFVRVHVPIDDDLLFSEEEEEDEEDLLSSDKDFFNVSGDIDYESSSGLDEDHDSHAFASLLEEPSHSMHLDDVFEPEHNDASIDHFHHDANNVEER